MSQAAEIILNPEGKSGIEAEACKGLAGTILGIASYMFLAVPILTFAIVEMLNLGDGYGIAVAVVFVITGLYMTEKFACVND